MRPSERNGDELAPQPLAVCTAVASGIETAEGLDPRGDVEREVARPHRGAVHPHKARRQVAKSRSELPSVIFSSTRSRILNHASI